MSRANVRRLFLAVFAALIIQYALVGYGTATGLGEPWPAVVLPGFKNVWDSSTAITVPSADFKIYFADGTEALATPGEVFSSIPASHHLGIMRTHFSASARGGSEVPAGKAAWLRERIEEQFGRPVRRIEVIWQDLRLEPGSREPVRSAVDTLTIEPS